MIQRRCCVNRSPTAVHEQRSHVFPQVTAFRRAKHRAAALARRQEQQEASAVRQTLAEEKVAADARPVVFLSLGFVRS